MMDAKTLKELTENFSVLYVEDEYDLRESLGLYLKKFFKSVSTACDGQEGFEAYVKDKYDIVITDLKMPKVTGIEMVEKIKKINKNQDVLIISAYTEARYFMDCIKMGVDGYIIKPIDYTQINDEIYKICKKIKDANENAYYKIHLEELVEQRTSENTQLHVEMLDNYEKTLFALVDLIEDRDTYTGGHSQRVAQYSKDIAKEMGYDEKTCEKIYKAGILHDIGKIITPDSILLKPGKLNKIEYLLIQEHVKVGFEILHKIPMYQELADIIHYHHERYDGKGYPDGLSKEEIPELTRIMIVADAFDAMTTNRIYKGRKGVKEACEEILLLSGAQFDPVVAKEAQKVLSKVSLDGLYTSQTPTSEVEQERFSYFYKDQVVDAYNKDFLDLVLNKNSYDKSFICLSAYFLHHFKQYNQKHGWKSGDEILQKFATFLKDKFPDSLIFRVHGDDFIVLHKECSEKTCKMSFEVDFLKDADISLEVGKVDIAQKNIASLEDLERLENFKV
ncbi:MAG: response regulator [Sulfurospirillaceae bacterium]|nr:response regulator [Sulfurospirillaceae bacterium]